jgi:histone chaperone ASF1
VEVDLCRFCDLVSIPPFPTFTLTLTATSISNSLFSSEHDQELDSLLVGPIPIGVNKFIFEADPPSLSRLPSSEILGVTVILLTCSYDSREFVRVGYYVNNEYDSEELNAEPPVKPIIERVRRNVLAEKPRVTRFAIKW